MPDVEAVAEQVFTALADPSRRAILAGLTPETEDIRERRAPR